MINSVQPKAFLDTGSTMSHVNNDFGERFKLNREDSDCCVGLAVKGCTSTCLKKCSVDIELNGQKYNKVSFTVLDNLLTDVILGQYFMRKHQNVNIREVGLMPTLYVGALQTVKTSTPVRFFEHLKADRWPIATKSRGYSRPDSDFISTESKRLLQQGLIEPSNSSWRGEPLVAT